jgi:hypothetical protein
MSPNDQDDAGAKAPYTPAEIIDYGGVDDLTENGPAGPNPDAGGSYS